MASPINGRGDSSILLQHHFTNKVSCIKKPRFTNESTAANYLAARQAFYFKDFRASADFYLAALNFDHNNADLLKQAFYAQYRLGNIDAAATLAREMELLNITSRFASEPATAQAILMKDWDAVLVLADLIAEDIDAQPVAAIIKAWALVAKGQGPAGLSHLIKSRNEHIRKKSAQPFSQCRRQEWLTTLAMLTRC